MNGDQTGTEKLFNDSYYSTETLTAEECAEITELLGMEGEDSIEPNWRPLCCGVAMNLRKRQFQCCNCTRWCSRSHLAWIYIDTPYSYIDAL